MEAPRLRLQHRRHDHREPVAAMNGDPEVMADLGGPLSRAATAFACYKLRMPVMVQAKGPKRKP